MKALGFLSDARFRRAERRVEAFHQGVESTASDVALPTLIYSAIEWLLLVACC